jgi:hypothetical protein
MLTEEHKNKRMAALLENLCLTFGPFKKFYKEKDLRTKMHCKKQLCNTSHPLERNTAMEECLNL